MERLLIEDLILEEFLQIIANASEETLQCDKEEEQKHREPCQSRSDQNQDIGSRGSIWKQEIFNIKNQTKGKTEIMSVDMIKRELGVKETMQLFGIKWWKL